MSAVAEREAATLEELEAALERKRERLRASSAKLLDLVSEEQVALDEFLGLTPDKNPWTVGTKPQRKHDEVVKVEREVSNLEREIGTLVSHVTREGALLAVADLKAKTEQVQALRKVRERLWKQAGKLFEPIVVKCWNSLVENAGALQDERGSVTPETLQAVQILEPEVASAWQEAVSEDFQPRDLFAFCEALIELTVDPRNDGHRGSTSVVETHFADSDMRPSPGEPRHTRTVVEHESKKYGSRLPKLLPDLRDQVRGVE